MTSTRVRERAKAGSALLGSCQGSSSSTRQISSVSARRRPRKGRSSLPRAGRMPARDRVPEPRARPSSTCSAWSSRVWPSRIASAPQLRRRGFECGMPGVPGCRLRARAGGRDVHGPDLHRGEAKLPAASAPYGQPPPRSRAAAGGPPPRRPPPQGGRPRGRGGRSRRRRRQGPANPGRRCRPRGRVPGSRPGPGRPAASSAPCRRRAPAGRAGVGR